MSDEPRTVVLTGVSRGLGRDAAERLVHDRPRDHYVVLARGDAAALAEALSGSGRGTRVVGLSCDLTSLADVRRAAATIAEDLDTGRLAPLGGLLGNAGVVLPRTNTSTEDGFKTIFGVNVLAHYLLVWLLEPRFTTPAWIVLTTSDTHFGQFRYTLGATPKPRWTSPDQLATPRPGGATSGARAYATSKLGVIYLVHALARRLPTGVRVFSYNPGLVTGTALFRGAPRLLRVVLDAYYGFSLRIGRGTTTEKAGVQLAETLLAQIPGPSGAYLDRGRVVPSPRESYDAEREEQLWQDAGRLVALPDG